MCDLVELKMTDFNIILGADQLYACYASINCTTRIVKFHYPNEPVLEWKGSNFVFKSHFISQFKCQKVISKGCIYHLVWVRDINSKATLDLVTIRNKFPDVFPNDLLTIPLREN